MRNAIGIDTARGDRLTMTAMPFEIDTGRRAQVVGGGFDCPSPATS